MDFPERSDKHGELAATMLRSVLDEQPADVAVALMIAAGSLIVTIAHGEEGPALLLMSMFVMGTAESVSECLQNYEEDEAAGHA